MLKFTFKLLFLLFPLTFAMPESAKASPFSHDSNDSIDAFTKNNNDISKRTYNGSKKKFNSQDLTETACDLNKNAHSILDPVLDIEDYAIYENDIQFINEFPFTAYTAITVPSQGVFFVNDINDTIKNELRRKRAWELGNKSLIEKYVKPGSIALDIGSHIGTHTVTMAHCVGKNGMVLAFEPSRVIHRELCYNLAINKCQNAYPIRCAIGKDKGVIEVIASHPNNEGGSYVIEQKGGTNTAAILPLDSFNLDNISFIKVDVENMEADVLDGAISTILRCRPVMLIEVQGNRERPGQLGENSEAMALISIEKIQDLGYTLKKVGGGSDYLAIPQDIK